jgi:hypothetical protein
VFHRKSTGEAAGVWLPPVCLNQAVVLTRDLTSHSSTASRSATSSQPQIMARVRPYHLGGIESFAADCPEYEPLLLYRGRKRLEIDRSSVFRWRNSCVR